MKEVENYLLNNKKLKIIQRRDMFNFSLDTVLVTHFAAITKRTNKIVDFGTNNAAIPLILSTLTDKPIIGVEIQKEAIELAQKNIINNNLEKQVSIIHDDINNFVLHFNEKVGLVICNPPFFKIQENSNVNENEYLKIARHEIKINLEQIIINAAKILDNKGKFVLIHRPDRLIEIITLMKKYRLEPKRLRLIYPKINSEANMILIEGSLQGNKGLIIEAPLIAHNEDGSYSDEVKMMFLGEE
ncbi:MAG: tRNA1(Val) (adenine(37)-N6)-methyltransferase [Bacilli bacterium]|jgi:tRNA1(Val) A37 N6-methylase TrmN6|nr:tRNA1(Val) (adenine(37)-N6)-methyltransferase [Bacilli bacterium]